MRKNEFLTALFIAKKNILKNRSSILLTILIISFSFISSTIIFGILNDVGYDLQENFIETTVGHVILEPYKNKDKIENVENVLRKIKTLPSVVGVSAVTKKFIRIYDKYENYIDSEVYIVDPEDFSFVSVIDDGIKEGEWLNKGELGNIVLGCINVASCNTIKGFNSVDVRVGETLNFSSNGYKESKLALKGIYKYRYNEIEIVSYITKETAKEIFLDYDQNKADQIVILLPDRTYSEEVVNQLSLMNLNLKILTWEDKSSMFSSIVDSFNILGNLSFFIGILISSISIYVILYINILNKRTQIGIIEAIGIKSKIVSTSYILLSLFLGILGALSGIILTLLVVEYFKFNPIRTGINELVPQIGPGIFILVSVVIIFASVLSGYIVSRRITKQNIIEAIFHG